MTDYVLQISDRWDPDSYYYMVGGTKTDMETLGAEARAAGFTTKLIKLSTPEQARQFLRMNKEA